MNNKLPKFKHTAIFLATIFAASIPAAANADWAFKGLGTLDGVSYARGINDSGQVAGNSHTAAGGNYQVLFITGAIGAGMTDLGTLDGGSSAAHAINDLGQAVEISRTADNDYHTFIYSNGGISDLSLLDVVVEAGWTNLVPVSINNNGQIAGYGTLHNNPT